MEIGTQTENLENMDPLNMDDSFSMFDPEFDDIETNNLFVL